MSLYTGCRSLSHWGPVKAQASLHIRADSQELSLHTHTHRIEVGVCTCACTRVNGEFKHL